MTRRRPKTPSLSSHRSASRGSRQSDIPSVVELSDSESEGKASPAGVLRTENFVESLRNDPHGLPDRGQVHFTEKFEIIEGHPGPSRVQYGPLGLPPDSGRDVGIFNK